MRNTRFECDCIVLHRHDKPLGLHRFVCRQSDSLFYCFRADRPICRVSTRHHVCFVKIIGHRRLEITQLFNVCSKYTHTHYFHPFSAVFSEYFPTSLLSASCVRTTLDFREPHGAKSAGVDQQSEAASETRCDPEAFDSTVN